MAEKNTAPRAQPFDVSERDAMPAEAREAFGDFWQAEGGDETAPERIFMAGYEADRARLPNSLPEALHSFQAQAHRLDLGTDADGQIQSRTYRYLTLAKLHAQVMPVLTELGLVWSTFPTIADGKPALEYHLAFVPGCGPAGPEQITGTMLLMLSADSSQGHGSALTYARRQAIAAVLGLVPDDDDDGKAAGDERLMVTRSLTPDEVRATRAAFEKAGADFDEALTTVDATFDENHEPVLTLAQGEQLRGLLKLAKGAER